MLQSTTTLVFHNAWAVNFNLSPASFKPNLVGVVNLINFTRNAMGHRTDNGLTPEELITTTNPAPNGYANSKYLGEHLLAQAAKQSFLHASFARVVQIAGPVRSPSLWNKAEWFPGLVLRSLHVGALPDTLGSALDRIDWVPVGLLAEVVVDLALNKNKTASESVDVFYPVNLYPLAWEVIRPIMADALLKTSGKTAEIVPFKDWVRRIRQDIETTGAGGNVLSGEELQALDIMSKSTRENVLDTQLTVQRSGELQAVEAVQPEWIQNWVGEWVQRSFIALHS
ncbi:hypothetical protein BDV24DRAFT_150513 [Aspergillus arachidicola]|uniref:Putative NRPS-like enzyme n=1 Tax=Aspergillus arachidicola TaxID=656916 RepID=A0A2G7G2V5_9EURO|nr:hypothetical protein BDV24DRAFT_150513 [Aspergillus arachidicola]PIG86431.1 putative NRPS-like enzyme [Aspergillus arachidicola]